MKTNIFEISTTAFPEENFSIITTLSHDEVVQSITPIVMAERNRLSTYDNLDLLNKLKSDYPTALVSLNFTTQSIKI